MARADDDTWDPADDREELAMLGLIDILAAHTRFLDEYLAAACRAGIRQVVLLASGMDTRPYRLWWPRGTTVYEIDRPQLLDFKSEVLRGLGATLTANRCAVGIDLRQDWLRRCIGSVLTRLNPRCGSPSNFSSATYRPPHGIGCCTTSRR
jgi:methyltransferase (TIGR00027 family)